MAKGERVGGLYIEVGIDDSKVSKTLSQIRSEVNASTKIFKNYDTALKSSSRETQDFEKALTANSSAMKTVGNSIEGMKRKLSDIERETDGLTNATKQQKAQYQSLQTTLSQAEANYKQLESAAERIRRQLSYEKTGVNEAEEAYKTLKATAGETARAKAKMYDEEGKKLRSNKTMIKEYSSEELALKDVVKALKDNIANLTREFGENSTEVNQAKAKLVSYQSELNETSHKLRELKATSGVFGIMGKSLNKVGQATNKVGQEMSEVGKQMTVGISTPIVAGFGASVKAASDFESGMNRIRVQLSDGSGDINKEMAEMSKSSKDWATQYGVSTSQINAGLEEIIKKGFNFEQTMGSMPAIMDATTATGEDFNTVMSIATGTIEQFGLKTDNTEQQIKNTQRVTDSLSFVANKTAADISDMGNAMEYIGPIAHASGISLEETSAMIGLLSNNAIKGEKAGTALRGGLNRLFSTSKDATAAFGKLGVSLTDFQKGTIGIPEVLNKIKKATSGMTEKQREAAMVQAFGQEAATGWTVLMNQGGDAVRSLTNETSKASGYTKNLADQMGNTTQKKVSKFRSSLINLGSAIGSSILPVITPFIDKLTGLLKKFGQMDGHTKKLVIGFGLLAAGLGPVTAIFGKFVSAFSKIFDLGGSFLGWCSGIIANSNKTGNAIRKIGSAAKGLGTSLLKGGKSLVSFGGKMLKLIKNSKALAIAIKGIKSAFSLLTGPVGIVVGIVTALAGAFIYAYKHSTTFRNIVDGIVNDLKNFFMPIIDATKKAMSDMADVAKKAWSSLKKNVTGAMDKAGKAVSKGTKSMVHAVKNWAITKWFSKKWNDIKKDTKSSMDKIAEHHKKRALEKTERATKAWGIAKRFADKYNESFYKTKSFVKSFKVAWDDFQGNIVSKIKNWSLIKWFSRTWNIIKGKTSIFICYVHAIFHDGLERIVEKVKSWNIIDKFKEKWESIKTKTSEFIGNMKNGISDMVSNIAGCVRNSAIGEAFTSVFKGAWNGVVGVLEKITDGAAWVLDKLGADSVAKKLRGFSSSFKKYANGTEGHPGGWMMVNDAPGSTFREMVIRPNGEAFIPQGRNQLMYGEKGTQVIRADRTANLMNMAGVMKYAGGTGLWDKMLDFGSSVVHKVKDVVEDVMEYASHPGKLVDKVFDNYVGKITGKGYGVDVAKGSYDVAKNSLLQMVKDLFASMEDGSGAAYGDLGSNKWISVNGNPIKEWQWNLVSPILKKYHMLVTDGGQRTWDHYDHSKGQALDYARADNPHDLYWKSANEILKLPFIKYVNAEMKSTIGTGKWHPSTLEPSANHVHVSFTKSNLSESQLHGSSSSPKGSGVERWRPYVKKALAANGLPTSDSYVNAWLRQIQTESSGNEKAMGGDDGLSDGRAMGLLQVKPPTFNANYHSGHGNIWNGYDNMLAAMNYAKHTYGVSGMLSVIGHGHGYENGGLILQHQFAQLGEGNKPEMVIPLTDKTRAVELIRQSERMIGIDNNSREDKFDKMQQQINKLTEVVDALATTNELLQAILLKDSRVVLDSRKMIDVMADDMTKETQRITANSRRLRGEVSYG